MGLLHALMKQVHDEIGLVLGAVEEIRRIGVESNVVAGRGMGSDGSDRIGPVEREGIGGVDIERSVVILVVAVVMPVAVAVAAGAGGPDGEIVVGI